VVADQATLADKELEILEIATAHFLELGYQGMRINQLSRQSGISKESVYRYFRSKQDLFEAVIRRELAEYERKLTFVGETVSHQTLEQALEDAGQTILLAVCTDRALALRRLIFQEVDSNPEIGRHYYSLGPERAYAYLQALFTLHRTRSKFAPERLARHYVGLLLHAIMLERQCGMRAQLSFAKARQQVVSINSDFLEAFFD
jgi:AcrR family transcriptional regulator